MAIKAQDLANFMVECTITNQEVGGRKIHLKIWGKKESEGEQIKDKEFWVLYFDGASKTNSSGVGLVLQSPDGFLIEYAMKLDFPTTNNKAEYEVLIASMGDSKLVVSQVKGEFEARDETMVKYIRLVRVVMTQFDECHAEHISREENAKVDVVSKFAS
ncbi:uncharacterized protein LOC141679523 [Apium graveolens]|uniref:uncharacterized protein LOC141679523 n=1 Tax=Apium graveolens TaxID=4045 RepID=UPI003D7992F2